MSCRNAVAPLAYEIPSKSDRASSAVSAGAPATGWADGARSAAYPQGLRRMPKSTQASANSVAPVSTRCARYSANDSLSHRSSHHFMVTKSPNHMWAIS